MKVLVQWAHSRPRDWVEIDSSHWASFAKKRLPRGSDTIDDVDGWINSINIQGVIYACFDHYAVEDIGDGSVRVTVWNDDPEDFAPGELYARVTFFWPLQPDPSFGGAYNTRQQQVIYAQPGALTTLFPYGVPEGIEVRPWEEFRRPSEIITRHGVWLPDDLFSAHDKTKSLRGWREWTEGLPVDQIKSGRVIDQRSQGRYDKPKGTRTYYYSSTADATALHSADYENVLSTTTGTVQTLTASVKKSSEEECFCARTPTNEPLWTRWPTGNYRFQIDCTSVGADITYGLRTLGSAGGHFARINTGGTSELETKTQQEGAFSGTGLKLATTGTVSWTAGSVTDRFEINVVGANANTKNDQTFAIDVNEADDFADGPWPPIYASDTIAAADAIETKIFLGRAVADSVTVSDQVTSGLIYDRALQCDPMVVDDTTAEQALARAVSDAVTASDAIAEETSYLRETSDSATVSDSTAVNKEVDRTVSDTVSAADSESADLSYDRSASDTEAVSDSTAIALGYSFSVSDTISASDSTTAEMSYDFSASDSISTSDSVTTELDYDRSSYDSISASDSVTTELDYGRQASDAVAIVDQTESDLTKSAEVSDTVSVTDQLTAATIYVREPSCDAIVTDDVISSQDLESEAFDSVAVSDTAVVAMSYSVALNDAAILGESGSLDRTSTDTAEIEAQEETDVISASSGSVPIPVTGSDRLLIVIISKDSNIVTTGVTYDGTPLVFAASASDGTNSVELWRLLSPVTGTDKQVQATFASEVNAKIEVVNYSGFNQWIAIDDFKFEIVRRWRSLPDDPWTDISFSYNARKAVGFTSELSLGTSSLSERIARWVNQNDIIPIDSVTALDEVSVEKI